MYLCISAIYHNSLTDLSTKATNPRQTEVVRAGTESESIHITIQTWKYTNEN